MDTTSESSVTSPSRPRRFRSSAEKRRIVEETLVPGVSVAAVARAQGINANQVFHWRKLYQAGLLADRAATSLGQGRASGVRLLPVRVAEETQNQPPVPAAVSLQSSADPEAVIVSGSMELTLAKAQIRITGRVDAQALRVVLECLRG